MIVLQSRTTVIEHLIQDCAHGRIPFSGPGSLCEKVSALGYKTTALYEMLLAYEARSIKYPKDTGE